MKLSSEYWILCDIFKDLMEWSGIENMQHCLEKKLVRYGRYYRDKSSDICPFHAKPLVLGPTSEILVILISLIFKLQVPAKRWYCRYYLYKNYCEIPTNIGGTATKNSRNNTTVYC